MTVKSLRFLWRLSRNALCVLPTTRALVFPPAKLSTAFGRGDAEYAWRVFQHHYTRLLESDFPGGASILEAGPGRNIGTSLLWWSAEAVRSATPAASRMVLWDVYGNALVTPDIWRQLAGDLLAAHPPTWSKPDGLLRILKEVAAGIVVPNIRYLVGKVGLLAEHFSDQPFNLIYSHAALEHAWDIRSTWSMLHGVTAPGGWHSHRIDLADHGSRNTNYIEMLEWSDRSYWLTMRFVPGAINRWRAFQHVDCLRHLGMEIRREDREMRPELPSALSQLAPAFRSFPESELRTTAVDIVARRPRIDHS